MEHLMKDTQSNIKAIYNGDKYLKLKYRQNAKVSNMEKDFSNQWDKWIDYEKGKILIEYAEKKKYILNIWKCFHIHLK